MSAEMNNQEIKQPSKTRMIGNYLVGRTLGEGTFGKVKMATHQLTGEKVAIKILEKDRIIEVADVERVQREIHILKLVRHPHIIQLYEIIETPKHIFLVMEFISGGELFDHIVKNTRLKEPEACKYFQELISGVEYLHRLKVVHRDLKPENLLLDDSKNIKIVDFGLSNTYKENELLKTACGSPCYAAPEMIAGQKYTGIKVDIWSCGVILFASLCGYLPFEVIQDQNTSALYKKILSGDYTLPKFLSKDAIDFLKGILNTDPEKRFGAEEIRKQPWFQIYKRSYEIPPGIVVGYNRIPIDIDILNQLEKYGFLIDYGQKCLDANKHNHVTTTYHLLLKKFLLQGGKSTADLNSESFDITLLQPKLRPQKPQISTLINNEVIRQQMNEKLKERSFSTNNERPKGRNNYHVQTNNGQQKQPIIQDNDTSVLRIDQVAHSVQHQANIYMNGTLLTNSLGNNTIDEIYKRGSKKHSSMQQGEDKGQKYSKLNGSYQNGKPGLQNPIQQALINNQLKNRQLVNSNYVNLKDQGHYQTKKSSSKGNRIENELGSRSQKDRSEIQQSNQIRNVKHQGNMSFDLSESGRLQANYFGGNVAQSSKSKKTKQASVQERKLIY